MASKEGFGTESVGTSCHRTDVNGSRKATADNLEQVGYGRQCNEERLWSSGEERRGSGEREPCYVQLDMREEGDARLASVYKPDRRRQLQVRPRALSMHAGSGAPFKKCPHLLRLSASVYKRMQCS